MRITFLRRHQTRYDGGVQGGPVRCKFLMADPFPGFIPYTVSTEAAPDPREPTASNGRQRDAPTRKPSGPASIGGPAWWDTISRTRPARHAASTAVADDDAIGDAADDAPRTATTDDGTAAPATNTGWAVYGAGTGYATDSAGPTSGGSPATNDQHISTTTESIHPVDDEEAR